MIVISRRICICVFVFLFDGEEDDCNNDRVRTCAASMYHHYRTVSQLCITTVASMYHRQHEFILLIHARSSYHHQHPRHSYPPLETYEMFISSSSSSFSFFCIGDYFLSCWCTHCIGDLPYYWNRGVTVLIEKSHILLCLFIVDFHNFFSNENLWRK